nr:hypothetical protein [Actinomycetota bacterium]
MVDRLCYVKRGRRLVRGGGKAKRYGPVRGQQVSENESVRFKPMLVSSGPLKPDSDKYAFEVKWDVP